MASSDSPSAAKPSVSILGIGLMGNKFARRLASQGFPVTAWNRTPEKAQALEQSSISIAGSVKAAVSGSEILLLLLSDAEAIQTTLLQPDVLPLLAGKTVLQMGTIGPNESKAVAAAVEAAGATYVEAPVLGSQPEAEKGTLLIMVGCTPQLQPGLETHPLWQVLQCLGAGKISLIGEIGTAAAVKLSLNQLIASLTVGFSTSLGLVQRSGADVGAFMGILRESALYAPTFDKKLDKMLNESYANPNFPTKHLLKDVKLFKREAEAMDLNTALLSALQSVIQDTCDRGLDNTDYSAVHDAITHPAARQPEA
ncbi:MAG: hypothetical protein WDW38_009519 [Sanguina aurantia]